MSGHVAGQARHDRTEGLISGRLPRRLIVSAAVTVAGILALAGWMSFEARRAAYDHAVHAAENIGALLEHDIRRNIETYDLSLQAAVDGLRIAGVREMPAQLRNMILFDRAATAQYLGSIMVIDEHGTIAIDSHPDGPRPGTFSDREYFHAHQASSDLGLFISRPFLSRLEGVMEIGLSRRLAHPDGSFAGVVVGTLQLEYFHQLFESVGIGTEDNISLLNDAGEIVVRKPYDAADTGKDLRYTALFEHYPREKSGVFEFEALRDGIRRVYAFRQVGNFPLVLSVGTSRNAIFADWRGKTATVALAVACLTAVAGLFALLCLIELKRRARAEKAARESERRYRLLADYSTDMIVRASLEGVRRYVSPACRSLYGYEPDELVGTRARDFTHPDDVEPFHHSAERLLAGADKVTSVYRARRKDGSYVWVEASRRLVADPEAQDREFVVVVRDISERKEIEAELDAARIRAEAANEAKSRFLANMSHELRTPLNAVIGFSDLMAREAFGPLGSEKYRIYASDIRASGEHLLELINEVLDHAKAESGHLQLNEEVVPLAGLIEFAVRLLAPRAEGAGIELRTGLAAGLHAVRGDERRLKQILLNLITNAIKFTPSGGHVAISAALAAGGELVLTVEDSGIGIAEEEQAKIFEPYMQAHIARPSQSEGTGLGLPLTKRLVELHGGTLDLRSRLGLGTTVQVRLPAARVVAPVLAPVGETDGAETVLVVDDDGPILRMAVSMLRRMGLRVLAAANANEALVHLQRGTPIDLLFTDMIMPPGMNGAELAEQARKLQPAIKILLTSGFAGHAMAYDGKLAHGAGMIDKPYGFSELRTVVEQLLGRSSVVSLAARQTSA